MLWERPTDHVPYPNVWTEFYANESKDSEKEVRHWIQDLPEERFNEAIEHMTKYFIPDEPICASIGGLSNKPFVEIMQKMWRSLFKQKMSLICLREGCDEIIAMNVNYVSNEAGTLMEELLAQVNIDLLC